MRIDIHQPAPDLAALLSRIPVHVMADLRRRYAEPQRAYHTWTHVEDLLTLFVEPRGPLHDDAAVLYAILFHDAVYDPKRADNEERSADLVRVLAPEILHDASSLSDPGSLPPVRSSHAKAQDPRSGNAARGETGSRAASTTAKTREAAA